MRCWPPRGPSRCSRCWCCRSRWPSASSSAASRARWPRPWRPACWPARRSTAANYLLRRGSPARLYDAITMSKPDVSHVAALDGYLAALVAYRRRARPGRAAGPLADRDVAAHLRVRAGEPVRLHHHGAVAAHLGAHRRRHRPRRPLRGGLDTDASHRGGDRRGAELRRLPGVGDAAGRAVRRRHRVPPLRRGRARRRPARRLRVRLGPAGGRAAVPAVPAGPAAAAGVARGAAVPGPRGGAAGAALLRGPGRRRAHAQALRPGPGRARRRSCSPTSITTERRSPTTTASRPTPSSAGSGTPCCGCTRTGSPTGRSPRTTSC